MNRFSFIIFMLLFGASVITSCRKDEVKRPATIDCPIQDNPDFKTNPKSDQYQALIDEYVGKGLPGVILLIKDPEGFYIGSSGMADIKEGIKMQPCHVSKIASITKFMIGVSIMRMQEKGQLSLDDPISKYIPQNTLDQIENCDQNLTIRNLMNHTSGIYDVIDDQGFYLQVLNNPSRHW